MYDETVMKQLKEDYKEAKKRYQEYLIGLEAENRGYGRDIFILEGEVIPLVDEYM